MVVCVYLLDTAPVVMDFQDHDVKMVRIKSARYTDVWALLWRSSGCGFVLLCMEIQECKNITDSDD